MFSHSVVCLITMSPGRNENKWNAHLLIAFHPKAQIIMDVRQVSWLSTLLTPSRRAKRAPVAIDGQ
jgi:hypothetical protein